MRAATRVGDASLWLGLGGLLLVLLTGLYLSQSRGAWLVTAGIALVVFLCLLPRRPRLVVGGVLVAGAIVIGPVLFHSLWTGHDGTALRRVFIWLATLRMIGDHPMMGIGFARFLPLYSPLYSPHPYWIPVYQGAATPAAVEPNISHAHNILLDFWLNTGLLGLLSYVWLMGQLVRLALQRSRLLRGLGTREARLAWAVLVGSCLASLALMLHGLVDETYFTQELTMLIWTTIVVVLVSGEPSLRRAETETARATMSLDPAEVPTLPTIARVRLPKPATSAEI